MKKKVHIGNGGTPFCARGISLNRSTRVRPSLTKPLEDFLKLSREVQCERCLQRLRRRLVPLPWPPGDESMTSRPGPPPIELIIADAVGRTDTGYALGVHMHGLHGTWHRLWGMLVLQKTMGEAEEGIRTVRGQLDLALGRPISDAEMARLDEFATAYAARLARNADGSN
jgi:hypothetical protein